MSNYLCHYGVLGMRWGRRSGPTNFPVHSKKPLSQQQLGAAKGVLTNTSSGSDAAKRLTNSIEKMTTKKTDLSKMTDDDLKKRVSRMNLEQQYRNLSSVDKSKGAEKVRDILDTVGAVVTIGSSAVAIAMSIKALKGGN